MAASSNFKASGFTETAMQIIFKISSHDLLHLNILSSSWHFGVYSWRAQAFLLHHTIKVSRDFLGGTLSS